MYADGRMQWTTGDNSGGYNGLSGTEALAGINAGDRINHVTVSGSRTSSIINIARTSNVGIPGVWMFQVGRGTCMHKYVHTYVYMFICNMLYLSQSLTFHP